MGGSSSGCVVKRMQWANASAARWGENRCDFPLTGGKMLTQTEFNYVQMQSLVNGRLKWGHFQPWNRAARAIGEARKWQVLI